MSLRDAIDALDVEGIVKVTCLVVDSLINDFGIAEPQVGIVGLNPHAGEGKLFGSEDYDIVVPAVEECRRRVPAAAGISGPVVPDVGFREAAVYGKYNALIALYHHGLTAGQTGGTNAKGLRLQRQPGQRSHLSGPSDQDQVTCRQRCRGSMRHNG